MTIANNLKILIFFLFLSPLVLFASPVFAYQNPGQPTGFVNDYAKVLTDVQKQALETKLSQFEKDYSNEIVIAIIPDLGGDTVDNFANALFKDWGIGKKDKDNGVLILVAINDHQMRIEPGYGLEGALTDAQSFWIINNTMKPAFQNNDYYGGLDSAVDKIMAVTKGEYVPSAKAGSSAKSGFPFEFIFVIGFVAIQFLASILGKSKSWWAGGVIGFITGLVFILFLGWVIGLIISAVLTPLGLFFDYAVSKSYQKYQGKNKKFIPWWFGGTGGFGGGGSSGGFGGFGGGSSGGGGASGGW